MNLVRKYFDAINVDYQVIENVRDVNKDVGSDSENLITNIEEQDAEEVKSEEVDLEVFNIDFDGKTIEYTVSSVDEDDFVTEFSRAMYIFMLDGFTRQFYLQSDYSNGEDQPKIIFYDEGGSIITENNDFIEMGIDEE